MSRGAEKRARRKQEYRSKLVSLLTEYDTLFLVSADNVGSKQMQTIRKALRGKAIVLMGKNTMIRKVIRDHLDTLSHYEPLLPHLVGNVGFVFTKEPLSEVRALILENRVQASAKAGSYSPVVVNVPKGPTGMEPTKTSFFQALAIPTRISRGVIEIINDVHLLDIGDKVTASQAVLLQLLGIKPFQYGLKTTVVYDQGTVYESGILDLSDQDLLDKFLNGVSNLAALSLEIGYPTIVSVPHSLKNGFKNLIAISLETDYNFKQAQELKDILSDPEKLAALAAAATTSCDTTVEAEEEAEEEEEEEDEVEMGGLFGGDDDGY